MGENHNKVTRRHFVQSSGMFALGGGLFLNMKPEMNNAIAADMPSLTCQPWRPEVTQRLSQETYQLAQRALAGEHGRTLVKATDVISGILPDNLSPNRRYAEAARLIAENAPLRIYPNERIVGSASLLESPMHRIPVDGSLSVSHTTIGFADALHAGLKSYRARVDERLARDDLDEQGVDLLVAMRDCLDAINIWHQRHLEHLDTLIQRAEGHELDTLNTLCSVLSRVPENPPASFHEAVQSLWFLYAFQRLMGNWLGIGRIDEMLGQYLEADLKSGRITLDEAREILAHFWIKGCEWIGAFETRGTGDAQHYQNIILSGVDRDGRDVTNQVTYLILDIVEELHISDFPIAVRINSNSPDRLLRRIAEVQRHGGGIVAIYNEDVVIDALVKFGYSVEEARCFSNDGCWEVLIPGKTNFSYNPFDALILLNHVIGCLESPGSPVPEFSTFEDLYQAYVSRLTEHLEAFFDNIANWCIDGHAHPLVALFVEDCIERGRGYHQRGAKYNVLAPHAGRLANVANSLFVIQKLVFEEKQLSLSDFVEILRNNWEGYEPLRRNIHKRFEFFGNDDDEADAMMQRVFNDYTALVQNHRETNGILHPCGISTFGREIEWGQDVNAGKATADGHHQGAILATNFSPSPGTDKKGPTAVINSHCKMDFSRLPNGGTLELKLHPDSVRGDDGLIVMVSLMRSFVRLGGFFLHIDVVNSDMLLDAQQNPEKYPNLSVRIAGWSARFATLDKHWQDMIIHRTQQLV